MFTLHPTLEKDCYQLGKFTLSRLLLMNDANYPWFILVPEVTDITEIYQLSADQQSQLVRESAALSQVMMREFAGEKMNIAALGNIVPQLHIHHVVRYQSDPAWPDPIWGKVKRISYLENELDIICQTIISALPIHFSVDL